MTARTTKLAFLAAALLLLCGFRPFTQVKNVCPKCPTKNVDVVVMHTGAKVQCKVAAENADYYIVERLGEYRAIPRADVASIEWAGKRKSSSNAGDQVILEDGLVLHGTIIRQDTGRYYVLQIGKWQHVVWASQAKAVYKKGVQMPLGNPPRAAPSR